MAAIPRSPAGLLSGPLSLTEEPRRSPSSQSVNSFSSSNHPNILRRRSTDASGGLDYYWSNLAGNGINSSSSSLAISPSASSSLSASGKSRSHLSLRELSKQLSRMEGESGTGAGPSNRRIQVVSYPSSDSVPIMNGSDGSDLESPGGYGESDSGFGGRRPASAGSSASQYSPVDYFGGRDGEQKRGIMGRGKGQGQAEWENGYEARRYGEQRESVASGTTVGAEHFDSSDEPIDPHRTPIPPPFHDRSNMTAPKFGYTPSSSDHQTKTPTQTQTTPTQPAFSSPSTSHYTPSSGRLAFVAAPDVSRSSIDALEQEVRDSDDHGRMNVVQEEPGSAPAWQSEFGLGLGEEEGEETVKARGRNRRTLPAMGNEDGTRMHPVETEMLSPRKHDGTKAGQTPQRSSFEETGTPNLTRSPEPPPRSTLRAQRGMPVNPSLNVLATTPLSVSPRTPTKELPRIINTPNSPDSSSPVRSEPRRPTRSPVRTSPAMTQSTTITDLTELLGGAIDAIGLIDSRETPPPTVIEPSKREKPDLTLGPFPLSSAPDLDGGPITPNSLPSRNASLPSSTGIPVSATSDMASVPEPTRRAPDGDLMDNVDKTPRMPSAPTMAGIAARPWPAAMLYGHVKTMKHAGDRAKGYAKGINELAKAETGLRDWCAASAAQLHRPTKVLSSKVATHHSLGIRANSLASNSSLQIPEQPIQHQRNVSTSSELPMRADSYAAREISQRVIDPSDQPTSLPAGLPYPQLQPQHGMRPSQSMQSMASFAGSTSTAASNRKGFFSGMRKGKKDSLSIGIGPPNPTLNPNPNFNSGMAPKKDVRGLAISGPQSTSPTKVIEASRISSPMGPRGPRLGSYTPPPGHSSTISNDLTFGHGLGTGRASLDTGLSRMAPQSNLRNSIDSTWTTKSAVTASPLKEEDVRNMCDVLPHVEKGVLRAYLGRYGDQMSAIGAYLEDEKRGVVRT